MRTAPRYPPTSMRHLLVVSLVVLTGCRKDPPAAPSSASPTEITSPGAYHAIRCGDVTALWSGGGDDLKEAGPSAPKAWGASGLTFRVGATEHRFTPQGELSFSDWSFDVFSPDCSHVALLQDRFGPFSVFTTADVAGFKSPRWVKAPGAEGAVHGQWRWTGPASFEFVASSGGGARVFSGLVSREALRLVLEVNDAPKGVRPTAKGWEAVP